MSGPPPDVASQRPKGYDESVSAADASRPALVPLLDLEPGLASRLRENDRAEARAQLLLRAVDVPPGPWSPGPHDAGHPFGLVVVHGLLLHEVLLNGRRSQQLLGPGDLVLHDPAAGAPLGAVVQIVAATPVRAALLDDRLQPSFATWPGLAIGLLERAGAQLARSAVHSAIAQLPRVEDRLEAIFWHLADRWGHATPAGTLIPLPLTHEALARLVGGRRPTISLALAKLAERQRVVRRPDGSWLILGHEPVPVDAEDDAPLAPALMRAAEPDPPPGGHEPSLSAIRDELAATVQRTGAEYAARVARTSANQARYAETRRRSRALRAANAQRRAQVSEQLVRVRTPPSPPAP